MIGLVSIFLCLINSTVYNYNLPTITLLQWDDHALRDLSLLANPFRTLVKKYNYIYIETLPDRLQYAPDDAGHKSNIILLFLFVFVPVRYVSMSVFCTYCSEKKIGNWNLFR